MQYILSIFASIILLVTSVLPALSSEDGENYNIVLITVDALRADHLSCYGYKRNTSPHIDKIACKGIIFKNAIAPSSYTVPSMTSLFTSLYPTNHGVFYGKLSNFYPGVFEQFEKKVNPVIPDELTTLPEVLKLHGYNTFGVSSNLLLDEKTGFAKGFDYFKHSDYLPASDINKIVFSLEDEIKKSDKFFLWVHYMDPHFPYHPRDPWIEQYTSKELTQKLNLTEIPYDEFLKVGYEFEKNHQALSIQKALYDSEINFVDFYVDKLIKKLDLLSNLIALYDSEINFVDFYIDKLIRKLDFDNDTLIIITADHGEEFLEHGCLTHGNNLYNETIRVPLIVKLPWGTGKIKDEYVNLIDIMPSILYLLDIDLSKQMLGKSFLQKKGWIAWLEEIVWGGETSDYTFSEISKENVLKTVMTGEWKYIHDYRNNNEMLYNIAADPLELNNLMDTQGGQGTQLKEQLFNWASSLKTYTSQEQPAKLTPEEEEKLKSIGYMQ